ncbi:unnamed protein product, partial [marine sediment metagenome]
KYTAAQDEKKGTFIEEQGEKQDSTIKVDVLDFYSSLEEDKSSATGIVIGIAAVVLMGGGIIYLIRRKKKALAE